MVAETYQRILKASREFGQVHEDPKKTSIHLVRRTAFAGIATQKSTLVLTLKAARDITSARIRRHQQASRERWHLEVKLSGPDEVDAEVVSWLRAAYELSG